jgi:hypothetical protein
MQRSNRENKYNPLLTNALIKGTLLEQEGFLHLGILGAIRPAPKRLDFQQQPSLADSNRTQFLLLSLQGFE